MLQDCMVHALLSSKQGGYFVDLAANDAIILSNTRALERDHGWRGLCIEPNPRYHAGLLQYRSCSVVDAAVSDSIGEVLFDFGAAEPSSSKVLDAGAFGRVVGNIGASVTRASTARATWQVPIGPILEFHAAPPTIDFMSLDVEGHEHHVMKVFPFERYNVSLLLIERPDRHLRRLLDRHGYMPLCSTPVDSLFAHWPPNNIAEWAVTPSCASNLSFCWSQTEPRCGSLVFPHVPACERAGRRRCMQRPPPLQRVCVSSLAHAY
jgi:FkbM family methyltransferase